MGHIRILSTVGDRTLYEAGTRNTATTARPELIHVLHAYREVDRVPEPSHACSRALLTAIDSPVFSSRAGRMGTRSSQEKMSSVPRYASTTNGHATTTVPQTGPRIARAELVFCFCFCSSAPMTLLLSASTLPRSTVQYSI